MRQSKRSLGDVNRESCNARTTNQRSVFLSCSGMGRGSLSELRQTTCKIGTLGTGSTLGPASIRRTPILFPVECFCTMNATGRSIRGVSPLRYCGVPHVQLTTEQSLKAYRLCDRALELPTRAGQLENGDDTLARNSQHIFPVPSRRRLGIRKTAYLYSELQKYIGMHVQYESGNSIRVTQKTISTGRMIGRAKI
jgi:hypothetical protein